MEALISEVKGDTVPAVAIIIFCEILGRKMVIKSSVGLWQSLGRNMDENTITLGYAGQGRFLRSHVGK